MSCELVVLFNPKNDGSEVISQLEKYLDKLKDKWSMVICSRMTWTRLEGELQEFVHPKYEATEVKGYDKVTATSKGSVPSTNPRQGFNSLTYKKRPICYTYGDNVVSARVGATDA